jgi:hypothetical protein
VERSWETHQDRLTAELTLAGIRTMAAANAFLPGNLARYRERFAMTPRGAESAYVPMAVGTDLGRLFCFKCQRRVAADNTIPFGGRVLQIPPGAQRLSYVRVVVDLHERLDGTSRSSTRASSCSWCRIPPRSHGRSGPGIGTSSLPRMPPPSRLLPMRSPTHRSPARARRRRRRCAPPSRRPIIPGVVAGSPIHQTAARTDPLWARADRSIVG